MKDHLNSALQTFLASFIIAIASPLIGVPIQWTTAFWGSLALTALRVAIKAAAGAYAPEILGGKPKGSSFTLSNQ